MSIEHAKDALKDFLQDPAPTSLVLTGRWGVGKSFVWDQVRTATKINRPYARVSLFGVADLQALKTAIFLNTVAEQKDTKLGKGRHLIDQGKQFAPILKLIPQLKDFDPSIIYGHLIKDSLICLDDLERRPEGLDLKEVLGLVSFLKEERGCKIIVIANDEAFEEGDADFRTHFEKVFDRRVRYEPTSSEAVAIACPGSGRAEKFAGEFAVALGITNIRVLRKLRDMAVQVEGALSASEDSVVRDLVRSVVVIGRSVLEPKDAPSVEFLREDLVMRGFGLRPDMGKDEKRLRWEREVTEIGFEGFGPEEKIVSSAFEKGYLDRPALTQLAAGADARARRSKAREPFNETVAIIQNSWSGTTERMVDRLDADMTSAGTALYLGDLSAGVRLLEALGRPELAQAQARRWIDAHSRDADVFKDGANEDIPKYPDLLKTMIYAYREDTLDNRTIDEVLAHIESDAHHLKSLIKLGSFSTDEIVDGLRRHTGQDFRRLWQYTVNQAVSETARDNMIAAVQRLAGESALGKYRAGRVGIAPAEST